MSYISPLRDLPFPRRVAIMGSTGSIGRSTLSVLAGNRDQFSVSVLAGGRNLALLALQAGGWRPPYLAILDKDGEYGEAALRSLLPAGYHPHIFCGPEGYAQAASLPETDMVVSAQAGSAGLRATLAAAAAGKVICLANKESLVLAGSFLRDLCRRTNASILPVDSEHWAIFQCLSAQNCGISRLLLTASGGPFRNLWPMQLRNVRPEDALAHPTWSMGKKITIDSATLMNKGLEIIEACHLYQLPIGRVDAIIHPQSLVHSLVEFGDGSMLAQLAVPDMRLPIAGCLAWPRKLNAKQTGVDLLDLAARSPMDFERPDRKRFPCLELACRAFSENLTPALNAADEVAIDRFLKGEIRFTDIPRLVERVLDISQPVPPAVLSEDTERSVALAIETISRAGAEASQAARLWLP